VAAGLRLLAAEMKNVSAPPRVEAHLVRAYRERYAGACRPRARLAVVGRRRGGVIGCRRAWTGVRQPPPSAVNSGLAAVAASEEEDAAFVPLPNAAGSPQDDDVDLVWVELPRSAVTALECRRATIATRRRGSRSLVGPDGMARAVRFLN